MLQHSAATGGELVARKIEMNSDEHDPPQPEGLA